MIVGLVLARTDLFGNGLPPLLGVVECRIHIEDDTAEGKEAVPDDLPDLELGVAMDHVGGSEWRARRS
jgi:hypothetical protein